MPRKAARTKRCAHRYVCRHADGECFRGIKRCSQYDPDMGRDKLSYIAERLATFEPGDCGGCVASLYTCGGDCAGAVARATARRIRECLGVEDA